MSKQKFSKVMRNGFDEPMVKGYTAGCGSICEIELESQNCVWPPSVEVDGKATMERVEGLFAICRSIIGNGARRTRAILRRYVPLEVTEVPSGTAVLDWTVLHQVKHRGRRLSRAIAIVNRMDGPLLAVSGGSE